MRAGNVLSGWRWYVLISVLLGLVCALIGPFGTFNDMSLPARLVYWLAITEVNGGQVLLALAALAWWRGTAWPAWALGLAAAALGSVPAAGEMMLLEAVFRRPVPVWALGQLYLYVLVLTVAISVPIAVLRSRWRMPAPTPAAAGPAGETLLKRLKPEARGAVWALQMEDHYLRVHTSAGNDLILHRMSDALAEVAGLDGRQVHRSYWVAREAVDSAERDGRRLVLVLKNGLKVPVARANLSELRAAGWL